MRLFVLACLFTGAVGTEAHANGRAPGTSTINFQRNNESHIAGGMTFGVVLSTDNGATWTWMCEEAVGYGGNYDPDYGFTSSGALFATTFDGLKVNRGTGGAPGCVYDASVLSPAPPTIKFFSTIAVSKSDGALFAAAADPTDNKIYKSTDDGMTFPVSVVPAGSQIDDWYQSIEVAPSDGNVIYVAGYRLKSGQPKVFLMWRSSNGGTSYEALPVTDIAVMPNSTIEIAAISKTNPDIVYARVVLADNNVSDAIWRSIDGGQNWVKLIEKSGSVAFVARQSGELVAGTQALGTSKAQETGNATVPTFSDVAGAPHISCLAENSAGEVFACTQNYGSMSQPSDGFGIMKSTDLATWTGVLKFQDLKDPVACAAGTPQKDRCDVELWCGLCAQLGCDANRNCAVSDGPPTDGTPTKPKTCCQAGNEDLPTLGLIALALGMVGLRRRRR
jgi:MYXO-CTERM domain-containing protein